MNWRTWYDALEKPAWTPEPATIGLIWQILYPIILISFGYVFWRAVRRKISWRITIPFVVNLLANVAFTPIQFGLRNLPLAAVDIALVWITIPCMMVAIWKHHRWVALAQIPYFIWVTIASVLQFTITWNNR